jgi:hypothetical protein
MPILGIAAAGGLAPKAPTIGTATDPGTGTSASITFTAPTWPGKGSGTVTYTATSSPGSFTGTATSSPVTVSGLTAGTAYTFTVKATTSYGVTGPSSAASNSVTPAVLGDWDWIASLSPTGVAAEFTSIPSGYQSFRIIGSSSTVGDSIGNTTINGYGAQYAEFAYYGTPSSNVGTAGNGANSSLVRRFASNTAPGNSGILGPMFITYYNAGTTIPYKPIQITSSYSASTNMASTFANGINASGSATISSIKLATGNGSGGASAFLANTNFTLYGMKA